ncbi:MAG: hypothetical protein QXX08_05800 [Candidatus Bathyarchaeia archaeon]
MGRTVDREDLNREQLTEQLRKSNEVFRKLRGKSLLGINFDDKKTVDAIKEAYNSAKAKYIGAGAISKVLHLLNPELFVMWDGDIRKSIKLGVVQRAI